MYPAPTDDALRYDIEITRRLGYLELPDDVRQNFRRELKRMIDLGGGFGLDIDRLAGVS